MSTTILDRPAPERPACGGIPARRAVVRWAVRLARREWRQQLLIFALITAATAGTLIGSAVATTTRPSPAGVLGTAQYAATLPPGPPAPGSPPRSPRSAAALRPG